MFIKEIRMNGFKSYKTETTIKGFSKGFNAIVGLNGSGKSNLFLAIQLALTNEYNSMRQTDRVALLSHGRDPNKPAYVEVVFDNKDRKLPFDDDTVAFRRMIACKKDRLLINGVDRTADSNILTTAGFLNPFYFVKQGRINSIAAATDNERLTLIKDISGVKSYELKKISTLKELGISQDLEQKIATWINKMKDEKTELLEEVKALEALESMDKSRRAIEFVLTDRDNQKLVKEIEKVEGARDELATSLIKINFTMTQALNKSGQARTKSGDLQDTIAHYETYIGTVAGELNELLEKEAQISNNISEVRREIEEGVVTTSDYSTLHASRQKELRTAKKELNRILSEYEMCKNLEQESTLAYSATEASLKFMEDKMCLSPKDRLEALNAEESSLLTSIENQEVNRRRAVQSCKELKATRLELEQHECSLRDELDCVKKDVVKAEAEAVALELRYSSQFLNQKEIWARISALDEGIRVKNLLLDSQMQIMKQVAGCGVINGWMGVQKVLDVMKTKEGNPMAKQITEGYYGLLLENLKCIPEYVTAVEAVGGKKLLFHVVKNLKIGKAILTEFNKMQYTGEVTFLPLEELLLRQPNFPPNMDLDRMHPLLDVIQHDPTVANAIKHVFGQYLVCENLKIANAASKTYKVNCVTLDGDKVTYNGVMQGGYRDSTRSVMTAQKIRVDILNKIAGLVAEKKPMAECDAEKNVSIAQLVKAREQNTSRLDSLKMNEEKLKMKMKLGTQNLRDVVKAEANELRTLEIIEQKVLECKKRVDVIRAEKAQASFNTSRRANLVEFKRLKASLMESAKIKRKHYKQRLECEKNKEIWEKKIELLSDLLKEDVSKNEDRRTESVLLSHLDLLTAQAADVARQIASHRKAIADASESIQACASKLEKYKRKLDECEKEEARRMEEVEGITDRLDRMDRKTEDLKKSIEEVKLKVAGLGTVPAELYHFYNVSSKQLFAKLESVTEKIAGMEQAVNRKALVNLKTLEIAIEGNMEALASAQKTTLALTQCLETLDQQKGTLVLNTTRGLQLAFEEIFAELVPGGYGEMILYGPDFNFRHADGESPRLMETAVEMWRLNLFEGVAVRVVFQEDGGGRGPQELQSLSGGQKSIVALALIMALQRCEPTALYLFDEIDQALDSVNRATVAQKIKEMSKDAQFICTTFRKAFIEEADVIFGVSYGHMTSLVEIQSREAALDFIGDEGEALVDMDNGSSSDMMETE